MLNSKSTLRPPLRTPRRLTMTYALRLIGRVLTSLLCYLFFTQVCFANDNIFPAQPAAQKYINFDGKGFIINGKRTFLATGAIEYNRIPRELWKDRLMRIKRAGLNCVEIYSFWNYHEPHEGQFNFSGNQDLDAFLKLAKSFGLYVIARVGPYSCAEVDAGGYPVWLQFKRGMMVRNNDSISWPYITKFWDQLFPIVVNNQINRGGNVILIQLENEHPWGEGTDGLSNAYFKFLQSKALSYGMEVPYFFSSLNHGHEPGGNTPFSSAGRTSPWFSTEFWCVWFNHYGQTSDEVITKDRATWKIISNGGNGYAHYMFHGGTYFDYFAGIGVWASYDFGAAIGETGDLRPGYYKFKRAAWFARSFQEILETSDNATGTYSTAAGNANIQVVARQSNAGTILFLDNNGGSAQQTKVKFNGTDYPQNGSLTVNAREIMPFVANYKITPEVMLQVAPTRILGITEQSGTTTMVIYGQAGTPAELYFQAPAGTTITSGSPALSQNAPGQISLKTTFPATGAANYSFQTGNSKVRILAVNDTLADYSWFIEADERSYVVCGPQYIGTASMSNGQPGFNTESPWQHRTNFPVFAYDSSNIPIAMSAMNTQISHPGIIKPTNWEVMSGMEQAAPSYNTAGWLTSTTGPIFSGADGDISPYTWYRTTVNVPAAGPYTISFDEVRDTIIPFVDGIAIASSSVSKNGFTTDLSKGNHSIAVYVIHDGREKLWYHIGSLIVGTLNGGLKGSAHINQVASAPDTLTSWQIKPTNSTAVGTTPPPGNDSGWKPYTLGTNAFNGYDYAWFQVTLPAAGTSSIREVRFLNVDDNCWVYLNGVQIAKHTGWNSPFNVSLDSNWNTSGVNTLTLLVQNTGGVGGVYAPVTFATYSSRTALNDWVQQGGPGNPDASTGWSPLTGNTSFSGPQFFRCTFNANPPDETGTYSIWRIPTTSLFTGSIWVNGHNLGKYSRKVGGPGLYIPEKWLNASGTNTLVIYDAMGNRPDQVVIEPETGASRDVIPYEIASGPGIQSGAIYEIKTALNETSNLDVAGMATSNGANVLIWKDENKNSQRWKVIDAGNGLYKLEPQHAQGKALDADNQGTSNGTKVQIWDYWNGANQKWQINPVGGGYYELRPSNALNKVLDVSGANSADGTKVQLWDYANVPQQKWLFELVANPGARTTAETALIATDKTTGTTEITVSPNPVKDICWIKSKNLIDNVVVYDISGRLCKRIQQVDNNSVQINMGDMQAGTYLISITGSNFKKTVKVIKQ